MRNQGTSRSSSNNPLGTDAPRFRVRADLHIGAAGNVRPVMAMKNVTRSHRVIRILPSDRRAKIVEIKQAPATVSPSLVICMKESKES